MRADVALRAALAIALAAAAVPVAHAQVADLRGYPNLAAMKTWLDARSPGARQCATMNQLFVEASERMRAGASEADAARDIVRTHQGNRDEKQRAALASIATAVAQNAAILMQLDADSAVVAFAQLCADHAQRVKADDTTSEATFEAALKCESTHPAGSLARRECVAGAFRAR